MKNPYKLPRVAYCTGCGYIWPKMHKMIQHRRNERCGGRFLSEAERANLDSIRAQREELARIGKVLGSPYSSLNPGSYLGTGLQK